MHTCQENRGRKKINVYERVGRTFGWDVNASRPHVHPHLPSNPTQTKERAPTEKGKSTRTCQNVVGGKRPTLVGPYADH